MFQISRRTWSITTVVVSILLLVVVFDQVVKDRIFAKRWGEIEPGVVFRSGQIHPDLIAKTLRKHDINKIIDLQHWEEKPGLMAEREAAVKLGIEVERYGLNGNGTGNVNHYVSAMVSLHESRLAGEPVLVHCAAGSQRTGGVIAAYQTLVNGMSAEAAVAEMEQYDWNPNKDQILLEYLNDNIAYLASQMVLAGVISEVPAELPYFVNPNL